MVWRLSSMLKSTLLKHVPITWIFARTSVGLSYKIIAENDTDPDVPPLFLFHGLLGCKKHWEGLGKTLLSLTKRSVVVVDLRNHGDSPHVASHTYEELAADVLRLLEKLDIDKACLIGHSMGGRASMCSSLMAPEKVLGLLVVDISPISSPPFLTEYLPKVLSAMKAVEFDRPKNIRKARKMAKRQLKGLITDDLVMRAVLSNVNIKNEGKIGWTCNLDALINNFGHIKSFPSSMKGKKYQGPTLFVGGQLSDFIPPDDLTNIREFFPYAVIVTRLRDEVKTGHNLHVEEPKTFLEYVIAFVKTLPSAVDLAHKIHGQCSGNVIPIIVLHGLLGSKKNWESMSKRLAAELNTCAVVVDARNHGESPHDDSHSYPDLASDVAKLMDTISAKRTTIIGHSMGGRTGMVLALTQPDKVDRLVVVDISPVSTAGILNDFFPRLIDVLKSVKFEGIDNLSKAREAAKDRILASGVMQNMEGMNFILMNIALKGNKNVGWTCNLNALKNSFNSIATFPKEMENKKYYGPTLFVGGEKSNYIPPSDITGIKNYFPNAELKYIASVGHNVHAEDPSSFFTMVSDFLRK